MVATLDGAQHHRAIGKLIGSGEQDGYVWTSAPHYRPGSLSGWIANQHRLGDDLTLGQILRFADEIAAALEAAHGGRHKVLHGDLKPDNVVLNGPQPVVIDWGLARLVDRSEPQHSTGLPRGTCYFGAPEAFMELDAFRGMYAPYTDIWSLGATIYYLLTGEPPLRRDVIDIYHGTLGAAEIAEKARRGLIGVTPLTELLPDLPAEVAALVHRLLTVDPARRSSSAEPWNAAGEVRNTLAHTALIVARRNQASMPVGTRAVEDTATPSALHSSRARPERDSGDPLPGTLPYAIEASRNGGTPHGTLPYDDEPAPRNGQAGASAAVPNRVASAGHGSAPGPGADPDPGPVAPDRSQPAVILPSDPLDFATGELPATEDDAVDPQLNGHAVRPEQIPSSRTAAAPPARPLDSPAPDHPGTDSGSDTDHLPTDQYVGPASRPVNGVATQAPAATGRRLDVRPPRDVPTEPGPGM